MLRSRSSRHSPESRFYSSRSTHSSSRRDDILRVQRTIYNDNAIPSRRKEERSSRIRSSPRHRSRDRRSEADRSSRHSRPSASSRLSAPNVKQRSRSPVPRSADDLRHALSGNKERIKFEQCRLCGPIPCSLSKHLSSIIHKRRASLCKMGCSLCKIDGFSTYPQYRDHITTERHQMNRDRVHGKRALSPEQKAVSEDDEANHIPNDFSNTAIASEFTTVDATGIFQSQENGDTNCYYTDTFGASHSSTNGNYSKKLKREKEPENTGPKEVPQVHDPEVAYGVECITPIQGLYCRICKKFFTSERAAIDLHAKSLGHFTAYKRFVEMENERLFGNQVLSPKPEEPGTAENSTTNSVKNIEEKPPSPLKPEPVVEEAPQLDPAAYEKDESM